MRNLTAAAAILLIAAAIFCIVTGVADLSSLQSLYDKNGPLAFIAIGVNVIVILIGLYVKNIYIVVALAVIDLFTTIIALFV